MNSNMSVQGEEGRERKGQINSMSVKRVWDSYSNKSAGFMEALLEACRGRLIMRAVPPPPPAAQEGIPAAGSGRRINPGHGYAYGHGYSKGLRLITAGSGQRTESTR